MHYSRRVLATYWAHMKYYSCLTGEIFRVAYPWILWTSILGKSVNSSSVAQHFTPCRFFVLQPAWEGGDERSFICSSAPAPLVRAIQLLERNDVHSSISQKCCASYWTRRQTLHLFPLVDLPASQITPWTYLNTDPPAGGSGGNIFWVSGNPNLPFLDAIAPTPVSLWVSHW